MSVIIQKFLEPEYAGVWIGKDINSGILEYISGNGEKLVSGKTTPNREIWDNIEVEKPIKCSDGKIGELLLEFQKTLGSISDFEWLILNDKLFLLQYRPVTSKIITNNNSSFNSENDEYYTGIPASPGFVSGKARFVNARFIDKIDDWENGNILMAWYTDPEWMNILSNSSAIVTAVGGFLCHSAIIARELGIPCVIGIGGDSMKKIWNESELTVDGDNGIVYKGKNKVLKK